MSFYTNVNLYGSNILYRGYNDNGSPVQKKIKFSPTLFARTDKESRYKALIGGGNLTPVRFDTIKEAKNYIQMYSEVDNFEIHGNPNFISQFITKTYPENIDFKMKHINIGYIDIEVKSDEGFPHPEYANYPITSIGYKSSKSNVFHLWGLGDFDPELKHIEFDGLIQYRKCKDEYDLIAKFLEYWYEHTPDIITGWNIHMFDIPYMVNRFEKITGESKKLSPWGIIFPKIVRFKGRDIDAYDILGVAQMDYMEVFQKFGLKYGTQESYSLDHISHVVLGEKKLSYEEYGSLAGLYDSDRQKFYEYNIRDVLLVEKMEAKLRYMELAATISYMAGINFVDSLGTKAMWESMIYRKLYSEDIVPPPKKHNVKSSYEGAYVKPPIPGMYENIVSFDLNSLYPNIIVQYNMSPETYHPRLHPIQDPVTSLLGGHPIPDEARDENLAYAANGAMFDKTKVGIIPTLIKSLYDRRRAMKNRMLELSKEVEANFDQALKDEVFRADNEQMAVKIVLNALYGAQGSPYFLYYNVNIAEAITLTGQLAIKWAEKRINADMNKLVGTDGDDYVIAIDTDSVYVNMAKLVDKFKPKNSIDFLDKSADQHFNKILESAYQDLSDHTNSMENRMVMARECIATRGVWTGKKRYILNVMDNEGVRYSKPKLKVVGIESVKSSTPAVVRDKFTKAFEFIMENDEAGLQKFVSDFKSHFDSLEPEEISFPRGISNIEKWIDKLSGHKKGTPIHVRGAITYNNMLDKLDENGVLPRIKSGDKVKFTYMKMPNPAHSNVISYPQFLDPILELRGYVDSRTQYEKTFRKPLKDITDCIGWNLEKIATLEGLFG